MMHFLFITFITSSLKFTLKHEIENIFIKTKVLKTKSKEFFLNTNTIQKIKYF